MLHATVEALRCSFVFINNLLKEFAQFLIFVPSPEPAKVAINVKVNKEMVEPWWSEPVEASVVKSISFEGNELLAGDDESNVFPYSKEQDIREDALANMICEGYGIPSNYLEMIYNEEPIKHEVWLDRKFRRNFRNVVEADRQDELMVGV